MNAIASRYFGTGLIMALSFAAPGLQANCYGSQNYGEVQAFMRGLVAQYPATVRLVSIGPSDSGQTIEGLKIGSGSIHQLVVATHHGNESGSTDVSKALAIQLAQRPIPNRAVTIIPVLNISGYNKRTRWETLGKKEVDPNRDYPSPCGSAEGPFSLKSTKAVADYLEAENIVSALSLHDPFETITYPWGFQERETTPYESLFHDFAADAARESGYLIGTSANVIYEAHGVFEDYAFWKHGIWAMLYEIGPGYSLSPGDLEKAVRELVPGMIRFLQNAPEQRAVSHAFTGTCKAWALSFDPQIE